MFANAVQRAFKDYYRDIQHCPCYVYLCKLAPIERTVRCAVAVWKPTVKICEIGVSIRWLQF